MVIIVSGKVNSVLRKSDRTVRDSKYLHCTSTKQMNLQALAKSS